jgi:hypothetical protein
MRETRQSGSEGGEGDLPDPYTQEKRNLRRSPYPDACGVKPG